ncbi:MAG: hypothetical protein WC562_01525 [Dehalococcoidia bacterium]
MGNEANDDNGAFGMEGPTDEHLKAIGKVVVVSAALEEQMVMYMSLLFGDAPELVSTFAHALTFSDLSIALHGICAYRLRSADKLREICDMSLGSTNKLKPEALSNDESIRELDDLFDRIDKASKKRNRIVHSTWSMQDRTDDRAHRLSWTRNAKWRKIGWADSDPELVSVADLEEDAKFIKKVSDDLGKFIFEKLADVITRYTGGLADEEGN